MRRARSASPGAMNAEVEQELERIRYVHKIDEAIATGNYDSAHRELGEHQKVLEAKPPNRMIRRLWEELQHLLSLKTWAALFATLLSYKVSHDRQRGGHFATQRMRRYEGQADEFEKDPSKPPPPEADDVKQEREEEQAATRKKPPVAEAEARTWVVWGGPRERRSSGWWAWATVILCTVLAIAVIVAGAAVFAVYMLFKPKMPYLAVSDARLGLLQYDQGGTIQSLQMSITIRAENRRTPPSPALISPGVDVALLRAEAEPFVAARESSLPLQYNVVSAGRTLDAEGRGCRLWMRRSRLAWCHSTCWARRALGGRWASSSGSGIGRASRAACASSSLATAPSCPPIVTDAAPDSRRIQCCSSAIQ